MNKKILVIVVAMLVISMMLTTFALATPRVVKKWTAQSFQFTIVGAADPETGKTWDTPASAEFPDYSHSRKQEWRDDTIFVASIEVDGTTYDFPASLSYYALVDSDVNLQTGEVWITVKETITLKDESGNPIGTLKISTMDYLNLATFDLWGVFSGHGTGVLKGVKVFGTCTLSESFEVVRTGMAVNWPDLS